MKQKKRSPYCQAAVVLILIFYAVLSFFRLGNHYAPATVWSSEEKGKEILLDFGEEKELGTLAYFLGNFENRRFVLQVGKGNPIQWIDLPNLKMDRVFQWGKTSVYAEGQYLKLTTLNQYTQVNELILKDSQGGEIIPVNREDYPQLFDEAWMYPGYGSFQSGTVFDESYFARTAYEHLHGIRSYEDTHPPLGKLCIAVGIACFGMNPFGWRISGVVAGCLLLVVLWAFSNRVFRNPWISVGVVTLVAADFLHFTESRLGQIDSFLVLFMTGMSYFLFRYYEVMEKGGRECGWRYLFLSGICFGLAASCKWSGLYGGAGAAVIFAAILFSQYRKKRITLGYIVSTCGICVVFFILIPAGIYLLSYLPYVAMDETMGFWERVWRNQINMYQYHSHVSGYHSSASQWYQWPIIGNPVRLSVTGFTSGKVETVVFMGNPAFWWPGILMVFGCMMKLTEGFRGKLAFLLVAYIAPILPWIVISRYSFLYHYYPSIPFLAMLMGSWAEARGRKGMWCFFGCCIGSLVMLALFYPVISGLRVSQAYVSHLEWLPTWNFLP